MSTRRVFPAVLASVFALLFFGLGNYLGARQTADSDVRLAELRAEVELLRKRPVETRRHDRHRRAPTPCAMMDDASRASLIADVKRQLTDEMGLLPLTLLRERRESFVELYSYDDKRLEQLRHRRLSRQRLLHHRQARRHRARPGRRGRPAQDHLDQADVQGPAARRHGSSMPATRRSKSTPATGRSSRSRSRSICRR